MQQGATIENRAAGLCLKVNNALQEPKSPQSELSDNFTKQ